MLQEGGFPSELTVTEALRIWARCTSDEPTAGMDPEGHRGT
jgi:ABC-2 type transport system ATP-binding protein